MKISKSLRIILHIVVWLSIFGLQAMMMHDADRVHDDHYWQELRSFGVVAVCMVILYYFNSLVLIPRLLARQRPVLYGLSVLVLFIGLQSIVIFNQPVPPPRTESKEFVEILEHEIKEGDDEAQLAKAELQEELAREEFMRQPNFRRNILRSMWSLVLFCLVYIASSGIKIVGAWYTSENRKAIIEKEKAGAELSFLKAQINPHFLFNTLNNIYALALKKSDQAPEVILKLSDMMRYVLNDARHELVLLEREIDYISRYIALQQIRLTEQVTIDLQIEGDTQYVKIAPTLLIPFVENAFKYGASTYSSSVISIHIKVSGGTLYLHTENDIHNNEQNLVESTGIGIMNTRRRLDLLYPERYTLDHSEKDNKYILNLTILLS